MELHLDTQKQGPKQVKLVDKARRAFSISIDSSKAFELAIRKPRKKLKHKFTSFRSYVYSVYLLLMKHHATPPLTDNLTPFFVSYAAVLSIDILLLINFTLHLFLPITNMAEFGWAFCFFYFMVPYLSPLFAIASAISGNADILKQVGNLNSL